ncbi:hypothetical protein Rhe02_95350 [Rhizocola hellebori]|uniref:ATPase AAA-type core domain-containing protein n=1 Tax=Rhizocola hellebori TaxID=1392758 RepID=A0A8J3QL80_9ACTN|nr:hypothetical protein [Rhizocola hellebori]GIH11468.1 hypothetical protein Rhe02_95350 [Rhizocola hellebori]
MNTAIEDVYVTGDPTIDWAVEHPAHADLEDRLGGDATGRWHRGGALLLQDLLKQAFKGTGVEVHGFRDDIYKSANGNGNQPGCPSPVHTFNHHSYNELFQGPCQTNDPDGGWRVLRTIGFHTTNPLAGYPRELGENRGGALHPQMVVVDDLGTGFGDSKPLCKAALTRIDQKECQWVVLRLHGLFGKGFNGRALQAGQMSGSNFLQQEMFQRIGGSDDFRRLAERVVVVIEARSFRKEGFEVSRGLSWERSGQDVLAAMAGHPTLSRFRYVVINFGPTGALLVEQPRQDGNNRSKVAKTIAHLYFDRSTIEGVWERQRERESKREDEDEDEGSNPMPRGRMFGYTNILTASIARGLIEGSSNGRSTDPSALIGKSIQAGLRSMRVAEAIGFTLLKPGTSPAGEFTYPQCMNPPEPTEPASKRDFTTAPIQPPSMGNPPDNWSILGDMAREPGVAYRAAAAIAQGGPIGPDGVPYAKFRHLVVVDRGEVEKLRTVYNLIAQYLGDDTQQPLSVAVFGAPGDGKSFAVKELVKSIPSQSLGDQLEFNLSQLNSPTELASALHQVQDATSEGKVPLVFWDEFDTSLSGQALGWLRYFLSPMEDGTFQERDRRHPIGRAVFVFAGGTSKRYQEFVEKATSPQAEYAKGMDFLSRLKGYLEIVGPNPRDSEFVGYSKYIYRAVLLQAALKIHGLAGASLEEGVLRAFLTVGAYRHGARSLRAIVEMSDVHKQGTFGVSSLPPDTQLDLHVNAAEFLRIARGPTHDEVLTGQL